MAISAHAKAQNSCTSSEVRTEIIINAPVGKIWGILTDVKNYPAWNPFIIEIKGNIAVGSFVKFRMKGHPKERKFKARILEYKPDSSWAWGGSLLFFFRA